MNNNNITRFSLPDKLARIERPKCINPNKEYRILVPLNGDAEERMYRYDLYQDGEIRPEFYGIEFHEDTFYYMETRLFAFLNVECGLLINMYEEEVLDNDLLDKAIKVINLVISHSEDDVLFEFANKLIDCINVAKQQSTVVGFYF